VTVIGYVATSYGTSSYSGISDIERQVSQYKSWYPKIQGIFFDEMSTSGAKQTYYQTLKNYVSSLGMQSTFGNPGTMVDNALVGIFTNLVIYENPGLPSANSINQYYSSYGNAGFSFIAYGVSSSPSQFSLLPLENYVSYFYVTNLGGSNPYGGLPSYFVNEVAALASSTTTTSSSSTTSSITSHSQSTTSTQKTTTTTTSTRASTSSTSMSTSSWTNKQQSTYYG
jgi:hypothetical protein